jgi:hypothetical protein
MSEIIRVHCGGCDVKIKAPLKYQGRRVNCPQCGHEVAIPLVRSPQPTSARSAQTSAPPQAVAPLLLDAAPARSAPSKPVRKKREDQPTVLGDDAFLDPKPAARKPTADEFENLDFADYEDYGPIDDYGAPAKPRGRSRDEVPRPARKKKKKRKKPKSSGGGIYIDPSITGGLVLMLIGGGVFIWFARYGVYWFWPGILCIAGLIGMIKGLLGIDDDD